MTETLQYSSAPGVGILDIVLTVGVLLAGGMALGRRSRRVQTGAFLSLGVILSLVWLRLGSLDIAFAEAALGTGLLSAVLVWLGVHPAPEGKNRRTAPAWLTASVGVLVGALLTMVAGAVLLRAEQRLPDWSAPLATELPTTGVEHAITGVLLAFRGYDTLLESAVLLFAGVVVLAVGRDNGPAHMLMPQPALPSILRFYARIAAPVILLLGLWLLFAGSSGPGGAFQSGAVLAGLLILLRIAQVDLSALTRWWLPLLLVVGVIVFILAGLLGPVVGYPWLSWVGDWAFAAILTVEVFLTAGITAGLYLLYLGLENPGRRIREVADA